ncbi:GAF domain-containing protein [Camelimonas fluminis]|uniref:Blue-light-activated histidine kinase n=2 Tax=Camelimonas fluminis TaxID=1576911 RepID=A0ABV7UC61_9HYPH
MLADSVTDSGCDAKEAQRLVALASYDVMDTPTERDFDDIARLAADICETPIAVVNFIGENRQFFKAEVGLGVRETPFDSSFCARAILEEEFLVVPDATQDSRFDANPLVTGEPHLRFYAGALLKTDEGHPIGTVCVLDYQPRELTPVQQNALRILARQVMVQLELRQALKNLARQNAIQTRLNSRRTLVAERLAAENELIRTDEKRLRLAQHAAGIGIFELDVASDELEVSEEFCRVFGLPLQPNYPASILESLIVGDDESARSDKDSRARGTAKLDVEYRIRRRNDRELRWIARRARFVRAPDGKVLKMVGVVMDITSSKQRDAHTAALLSLGDRLRDAGSFAEATHHAVEALAEVFRADRLGYATVDQNEGSFVVQAEHLAPGLLPIRGRHLLTELPSTLEMLADGELVVVADAVADARIAGDMPIFSELGARSFLMAPVLDRGRLEGVLFILHRKPRSWSRDEIEFARRVADRTYATLERIEAEEHQRVLNHELSHRLKNTLAMVQAIASQTLRKTTAGEAVEAFMARIHALAKAHDVLLQESWSSARIYAVLERVLEVHADRPRFVLSGPDMRLGPKAGLSLSLIFHELATNAVKYGSLSTQSGTVEVHWSIGADGGDETFNLKWIEKGGPPVSEPKQKGFGSRLIQMGIAGTGTVSRRYDPNGFVAVFQLPMSVIRELV